MTEYVLGSSDHELERLGLQHEVWREPTEDFLSSLGIAEGARVLDVGCGPGFVVELLRAHVGPEGEVIGVDEAARWVRHVGERIAGEGWRNVRALESSVQTLELPEGSLDLVFLRWVLAFLDGREEIVERLVRMLRPGGVLAVMDYNHEGVSLFPASEGFDAAIRATRQLYATRGGDTWLMGSISGLLRGAGLEPGPLRPYVIAGGPGSPAFRWADAFFPYHSSGMVEAGVLSEEERVRFLQEWEERKANPDALFFSPIVAGASGLKPPTKG